MALPQRQPVIRPAAGNLADLTDEQRCQVERRRSIVAAWQDMCRAFLAAGQTKAEATRVFLEKRPGISERTLYEWARRRESGDPVDLIDHRSRAVRWPGGPISEEAWALFKANWLTIQQRTVTMCWQIVAKESKAKGWAWPGLRTIQRKVERDLPPIKADYFRLGEREWSRRWGPKMRRDYSLYRAGQMWVGDFHICDAFCRKSDADWTIVRPLLCAWLDLRSRIIPGYRIVPREDQNAVLLTFGDGVRKYGAPDEAVIDNGKPYRAKGVSGGRPGRRIDDEDYVRSVFGALEVQVHFSIPYNPDSKPIERWFRTFEEQFGATFASYCGGDNKNPRFKAASQLAQKHPERCPTVAEFAKALDGWLEAYHQTPHTGDGMEGLTPLQAFERFDPIPRKVAPDGVMELLLMRPTRPVKVTRYGVRYRGIEYGANDPRLFNLQGQEVVLRVDPQDASFVIVCDLEGKFICRAQNNQLTLTGVTQDDVAEGMKAKARARKLVREIHTGATRANMQTVTEAAISARLKAAEENQKDLAATGTEGPAPRNVRLVGGKFAASAENYYRQVSPPPPAKPRRTLEELAEAMEEDKPEAPQYRTWQDILADEDPLDQFEPNWAQPAKRTKFSDLDDEEDLDFDDDVVPLDPFGPADDDKPEMPDIDDEEWEDDDDPDTATSAMKPPTEGPGDD